MRLGSKISTILITKNDNKENIKKIKQTTTFEGLYNQKICV